MNDPWHRTDTLNPFKDFIGGKQIRHWIEFQLLDEQGEPLPNMPFQYMPVIQLLVANGEPAERPVRKMESRKLIRVFQGGRERRPLIA